MAKRTAIVICSHRFMAPLEHCLNGFLSMAAEPEDVIFVNNGSGAGLGDWVAERFPRLSVISLPNNQLFCGGYNAGIRLAMDRGYDFVLICNADSRVVNPGFMKDLLDAAERWPQGAFWGPQVYWQSLAVTQKTCLQFPNIFQLFLTWVPWRLNQRYFGKQPAYETQVQLLNGVCVLCRVNALKEFGLMDERFGGYVEDADWAWRARQKGWESVFVPVPSIVHHEEKEGYEPYSLKAFLMKRNTVFWFLKTGQVFSAWSYARSSIGLGWLRMKLQGSEVEEKKHRYFLEKLKRAYRGLFHGEKLGPWFGPPLAGWEQWYEKEQM